MSCPPCNNDCEQGRLCPARLEFSDYGRSDRFRSGWYIPCIILIYVVGGAAWLIL